MIHEMGFHVIDATLSIEEQQREMRKIVINQIGETLRHGVMRSLPGETNGNEAAPALL
jgi:hypothetical protein